MLGSHNAYPLVASRDRLGPDPQSSLAPVPEWLPRDWETGSYPASDETEAFRQWLRREGANFGSIAQKPEFMEREGLVDITLRWATATGRDAFRLARYLERSRKWSCPPQEPDWSAESGITLIRRVAEGMAAILIWMNHSLASGECLPEAESDSYCVTLQQAAACVSKGKRTLERWQQLDPAFPLPDVQGSGGTASEWRWSRLRPYLEAKCKRELPERFPSDPFRPDFGSLET